MSARIIFICISLGASILSIFSLYLPFYRWDDIDFNAFGKAMTLSYDNSSYGIDPDGYILDSDPPLMPISIFLLLVVNVAGCLLALLRVTRFPGNLVLIIFVIFGVNVLGPISNSPPLFGQYICLYALPVVWLGNLSYLFASMVSLFASMVSDRNR